MHVLIAHESTAVRSGIRDLLSDSMLEASFVEAADREQILSLLANLECALVLLDFNLPGSHGLDLLQAIKELHPGLPVLLLGTQPETQYAQPCMRAGAAGYICLDDAPEQLVKAVAKVLGLEPINDNDSTIAVPEI